MGEKGKKNGEQKIGRKFYFLTKVTFWCKVSNVVMSGEVMGKSSQKVSSKM